MLSNANLHPHLHVVKHAFAFKKMFLLRGVRINWWPSKDSLEKNLKMLLSDGEKQLINNIWPTMN